MIVKNMMSEKNIKIGSLVKHITPLTSNGVNIVRFGIVVSKNIYGYKINWQYSPAFASAPVETYLDHSTIDEEEFAIYTS
jgi:hypothetical protein